MPRTQQRQETERRILDTAADIFALSGFAGARMDEIARAAGVNKATIYYHIGNKEALYARVLHDVFGNTAETISASIQQCGSAEEKLKAYLWGIIRTVDSHPHVPAIMMREMASGGNHFPEIALKDIVRMFSMLAEILEEGRRQGLFIRTFPPFVHFMAVGSVIFFRNTRMMKDRWSGLPEVKQLEHYLGAGTHEEIVRLILRSVSAKPYHTQA